jgi:hypothetical protein
MSDSREKFELEYNRGRASWPFCMDQRDGKYVSQETQKDWELWGKAWDESRALYNKYTFNVCLNCKKLI